MKNDVLKVYGIVDPAVMQTRSAEALAGAAVKAVRGGATLLQYRDKTGGTREMIEAVRAIRAAVAGSGVPVLVNDRVGIALAAGAEGVHVGQDDMAPEDARRLLGSNAIIGLSIKTEAEVDAAPLDLLDYVCIGAVFATTSKADANAPIGLEGCRTLVERIRKRIPDFPVGAISGITAQSAGSLIRAGVDGVAVISEIFANGDIEAAARALADAVDAAVHNAS